MKKFIRHFVSFFLVAVMIVSSNITAFAANEKPVDSRFLPEITYTEDNTSTTRVPNLIPITVNPYYNKLVVHVGNLGVDSIDSVTWKETQAKSNVFSILLAFQTLSSRQLNNRGFRLIILSGDSGIITVHGLTQPMHCRSFVSQIGNIKSNIVSCAAFVSGSLPFFSITIKDRFTA